SSTMTRQSSTETASFSSKALIVSSSICSLVSGLNTPAFKVLLWVGAIAFLVELAISIPVAILTHHAINAAESRSDIIPLAILAIVFRSRIAGALILAAKEDKWQAENDPNDDSWRFGKQG
ncbi:MAG TPA: hypothetical protein IAC52_03755, partial [Candidatus Enteromonas pullicola]|nr:hypothetical protein [Candidatus Enteromonas pullicola]